MIYGLFRGLQSGKRSSAKQFFAAHASAMRMKFELELQLVILE